ncbi:DUF2971 domain-containing protein [Pseudomonas coronafaciens]|uniref:DUF2971 domain-containing protein n=1 Tax=Pseudomonas coronafaciens pv. coronafaciens TaxID=235275 RepID=A0AAE6QI19_9PSED|nr:DUF2971 domain-containing protein [Pseudomonas coronafaciens]QGT82218.1 DUF2971 domain-containing protein [Pseudomonas coronafaciens pv. coronafaciens]RMM82539.1 hypothetical protein ALQ71_00182 [Pseudomonas coronafaciens pv. striafaciens]
MYVFKYYRPNIYFDKVVRYNELYFAANHELNDPNDLKAIYYFEDNPELWRKLLKLTGISSFWNLSEIINTDCQLLAGSLNDIFKGKEINSIYSFDSLKGVLDLCSGQIIAAFEMALLQKESESNSAALRADQCKLIMTELLSRAINHEFYSVSFSKDALNSMMWAHYAEGFKGCVVIYSSKNHEFSLSHNPFAKNVERYNLAPIDYVDSDKRIPILECVTSGKDKAVSTFLQKNYFWKYENELRSFTFQELNTNMMAIASHKAQKLKTTDRRRILYHDASLIAGVIFGPRVKEEYQKGVEFVLHDNRYHRGQEPFFSLNTVLNNKGNIEISKASKFSCVGEKPMFSEFEGEKLKELLHDLNILSSSR